MSHSLSKLWVHVVWVTKYRESLISPEIEALLYARIQDEFRRMRCPLKIVNGTPDHVYCLFRLNSNYSLAEIMKRTKGSSSHFINELGHSFKWQEGYAAFSVSESAVDKVYEYIRNQKEHHGVVSHQSQPRI